MPEMPPAASTGDFNPAHTVAQVFMLHDSVAFGRKKEAWPAAAGVKLRIAGKKQRVATGAVIVARVMVMR